jgi:hypothetical protein
MTANQFKTFVPERKQEYADLMLTMHDKVKRDQRGTSMG